MVDLKQVVEYDLRWESELITLARGNTLSCGMAETLLVSVVMPSERKPS